MELQQLRALQAVADTGSFTLASRRLNVTQSALSHQIRKLEEELGETLLTRARPKVHPTAAGQLVLRSVERIFAELSDIKQSFATKEGADVTGTLRVGATNLGVVYAYSKIFDEFIKRYPLVEFNLTATETPRDAAMKVIARAVDVAFSILPIDSDRLEIVPLAEAEQIFITGPRHKLSKLETISIQELKRWSFVRYQLGGGSRAVSDELFLRHGGYPQTVLESNDTEFIKQIVKMGLGIALVPAVTVRQDIQSKALHPLRLRGRKLTQEIGLVHRKDIKSKVISLFKNVCIENQDFLRKIL